MAKTSDYLNKDSTKYLSQLGHIESNANMAQYTTFKTGGLADVLFIPTTADNIEPAIKHLKSTSVPLTVIGGGSNLLVGDKGIRGAVIVIAERDFSEPKIIFNGMSVYADAFVPKEKFVDIAVENGMSGVEFMIGIPGMIGGGVIMNAGTYMGSFADILRKIYYINNDGEPCILDVDSSMMSYRKLKVTDICAVTGVEFELKQSASIEESQKTIKEILDDRASKHPLEYPSAGSVFKNPEGHSSWQLIDNAGLKGAECGGAAVSTKHTNFIINKNNATSSDILSMIQKVQEEVYNKFKISLETEVKMIGEF